MPPAILYCRELWYRASLAWRSLLAAPDDESSLLVVAHNAVNQVGTRPPATASSSPSRPRGVRSESGPALLGMRQTSSAVHAEHACRGR